MRTFHDAKAMARSLRDALGQREVALTHSDCLEIVAAEFGCENWNFLAAKIEGGDQGVQNDGVGLRFQKTIPVLRIFDIAKAKEFYVDYLGFTIDWEHRYEPDLPLYMQVSCAGLILHLSEHYGDGSPGSVVYAEMQGIEAFHAEITAKKYNYLRPGLNEGHGKNGKMLSLTDPFGNRLRLNQRDG